MAVRRAADVSEGMEPALAGQEIRGCLFSKHTLLLGLATGFFWVLSDVKL